MFSRKSNLGSLFHSSFGGMWIDRHDAPSKLQQRIASSQISTELGGLIADFIRDGVVILPGAANASAIQNLDNILSASLANGDSRLRYHAVDGKLHVLAKGTDMRLKRIVEAHAVYPEVRAPFLSENLVAFLKAIFDQTPVLTQSLLFIQGSEQGLHQDTAFVTYSEPMQMAAAWIALEDVKPGSGELIYLPGSHRFPDYPFKNGRKDIHRASASEKADYYKRLLEESERRGLAAKTFAARKGDILIWHADLLHGGAPLSRPELTRKSLVGHFCPASVWPAYPHAKNRREDGEILFSSYLVNLQTKSFRVPIWRKVSSRLERYFLEVDRKKG